MTGQHEQLKNTASFQLSSKPNVCIRENKGEQYQYDPNYLL